MNKWVHICAVIDSNAVTVYHNGVSKGTVSDGATLSTDSVASYIGSDDSQFFKGSMNNVAYWNRVLSATEVQNVMYKTYADLSGTLSSGLVSWWALEGDATDSTGTNNGSTTGATHSTSLYGGVTPLIPRGVDNAPLASVTSDAPNFGTVKSGRALAFDGVVESLSVSDVSGETSFVDGESWTFACWVSFDIVNDTFFYAGDYSTYQPHIIFSQTDSCLALRADNGYYYRFGTDSLVADKWYRVVYVASSNTITAYLNGAQYGVPITTSTAGSNSSFTSTEATFPGSAMKFTGLGASYNGAADHLLKGKMSDGQVWDSAWSATDVQNDYRHPEMLAHTFSGTSLTESNLKLWYPMTEGNPESPQTTIFDGSPNFPDTNIVSNPHFETDTSGWTGSSVTIERAVPSIGAKKGTHACKVHSASGVDNVSRLQLTEIAENQVGSVFKVSAWVYVENTGTTGSGNYP